MQRHNQCRALSSVYKTRSEDLKAAQYIDAAGRHLSARDTVTITPRIKSVTKTQRQRKSNLKERWSAFIFVLFGLQLPKAAPATSLPLPELPRPLTDWPSVSPSHQPGSSLLGAAATCRVDKPSAVLPPQKSHSRPG